MTKSRIARRIYEDTPKETKNMVRLYGNYMVERDKKKLVQSCSAFTEEMYLGSFGANIRQEVVKSPKGQQSTMLETPNTLIFQSSINPKK